MNKLSLFSLLAATISLVWIQGCALMPLSFDLAEVVEEPSKNIIPLAVIGSGPAGFSAALYGAREGVHTVVFLGDKPGGLLTETTHVENWPAVTSEVGPQIMKNLQEQAERFGAHTVPHSVTSVDFSQWPFVLTLSDGDTVHAFTVIIATGAKPRYLSVSGEKEYWGKGVSSCAVCDAPFFKGEDVVVVGGGDSAAEEAMQLAHYAANVTVLVRKDAMRASDAMQKLLKEYPNITVRYHVAVTEIQGDGTSVTSVHLLNSEDGSESDLATNGVFLAIGHLPSSELVKDQLKTESGGYIAFDTRSQMTSVEGIYAAGDVADHQYRQAGVASGDGIKAAMEALDLLRSMGYNDTIAKALASNLYAYTQRRVKEVPLITTQQELDQHLTAHNLVLVDFYSVNCPPCMQMLPVLELMAAEYEGKADFVTVSIDATNDLVPAYTVTKVPTVLVFKGGELVARINTPLHEQDFKDLIDPLL